MQPTGLTTGAGSALASAPALLELAEGSRWRTPEVTAVLAEHAARVARDGGDEATALLAEGWLAQAMATLGRGVSAVPRAVAALSGAVQTDNRAASDRLRVALAGVARALDDRSTALVLLDPVLSRADLVPKLRADAHLEAALCQDERSGVGQERAEIALAALHEIGGEYRQLGEAAVYAALAGQLRALRRLAAAVEHAQAGLRRVVGERPETAAPRPSSAYLGATLGLELTLALLDQGHRDEAQEVARTVLSWDAQPGSLVPVARLRLALAQRVYLPAGARDEALAATQWVAEAVDQRDLPELEVDCYGLLAELREGRGELAEALAASRRAHAAYRTLASAVERALVLLVRSAGEGGAASGRPEDRSLQGRVGAGRSGQQSGGQGAAGGWPGTDPGRDSDRLRRGRGPEPDQPTRVPVPHSVRNEEPNGGQVPWMIGAGRVWQPSVPPVRHSGSVEPRRPTSESVAPPAARMVLGRAGQNVFPLFQRGEPARLGRRPGQPAESGRPRQPRAPGPVNVGSPPRETGGRRETWAGYGRPPPAPPGGSRARAPELVDVEMTDPLLGRTLTGRRTEQPPGPTETTAPDVMGGASRAGQAQPRYPVANSRPLRPEEPSSEEQPGHPSSAFRSSGLPRPDWAGPGSPGEIGLLLGSSRTERLGSVNPSGDPLNPSSLRDRDTPSAGVPRASPGRADRGGPTGWAAVQKTSDPLGMVDASELGDSPGVANAVEPGDPGGGAGALEGADTWWTGGRLDIGPLGESTPSAAGGDASVSWSGDGTDPRWTSGPVDPPRDELARDELARTADDPLAGLAAEIDGPTVFEAMGGLRLLAGTTGAGDTDGTIESPSFGGAERASTSAADAAPPALAESEQPAELTLAQLAVELLGLTGSGGQLPRLVLVDVVGADGSISGPVVSAVSRRIAAWVAGQLPPSARCFALDRGAVAVGIAEADSQVVEQWAQALSSGLAGQWQELAADLSEVSFRVDVRELDERLTVIEQLWDLRLGEAGAPSGPDIGGLDRQRSGADLLPAGGRHLAGPAGSGGAGTAPGSNRIEAQPGTGGRRRRQAPEASGVSSLGPDDHSTGSGGESGARPTPGGGASHLNPRERGPGGGDAPGPAIASADPGANGARVNGFDTASGGMRAAWLSGGEFGKAGGVRTAGGGGGAFARAGLGAGEARSMGSGSKGPGGSSAGDRGSALLLGHGRFGSWTPEWTSAGSALAHAPTLSWLTGSVAHNHPELARDDRSRTDASSASRRGLTLLLGDAARQPIDPPVMSPVGLLPAPDIALRHSLLCGEPGRNLPTQGRNALVEPNAREDAVAAVDAEAEDERDAAPAGQAGAATRDLPVERPRQTVGAEAAAEDDTGGATTSAAAANGHTGAHRNGRHRPVNGHVTIPGVTNGRGRTHQVPGSAGSDTPEGSPSRDAEPGARPGEQLSEAANPEPLGATGPEAGTARSGEVGSGRHASAPEPEPDGRVSGGAGDGVADASAERSELECVADEAVSEEKPAKQPDLTGANQGTRAEPAGAQPVAPAESTSVAKDSVAKDSVAKDSVAKDSVAKDSVAMDSVAVDSDSDANDTTADGATETTGTGFSAVDELLRRPVTELSFAELIAGALAVYRQV